MNRIWGQGRAVLQTNEKQGIKEESVNDQWQEEWEEKDSWNKQRDLCVPKTLHFFIIKGEIEDSGCVVCIFERKGTKSQEVMLMATIFCTWCFIHSKYTMS
jgi:hypothetical protein